MTAKESAKVRRLEIENAHLREQLDRSMAIYRENLYELIELRTKIDMVREAMESSDALPAVQ